MEGWGELLVWIIMAVLSAFFAGVTSILAKCGIKKTDSDVATAVRTVVVAAFSWLMVFMVKSFPAINDIQIKSLIFLILSGLATGASWICYFKALAIGDVNKVVPIDKSSTILSVLLAIILFQETTHLFIKITGTVLLGIGIFLMVEKKPAKGGQIEDKTGEKKGSKYMIYAVLSAIFAALTSILAKIGISDVESNLGTAIRTTVVLVMAWVIVFLQGKQQQVRRIEKKELMFISLSGIATGSSWLCYYYAIQNGIVSVVVPIDKLSIIVSILFSYIVFHEKLSKRALFGLGLMIFGTLLMALFV